MVKTQICDNGFNSRTLKLREINRTAELRHAEAEMKIMSDDTSWMASSQRLSIICLLILAPLSFILPSSHCSSILVILSSFLLQHACVCLCAFVFREREKHLDTEGSHPTGELQRAKHRCSLQSVSWTLASNRKALCLRTPPQPILWCNRSLSHTYSLLQPVVHPSLNWNWSQLHSSSSSTMSYSCTNQNWRRKYIRKMYLVYPTELKLGRYLWLYSFDSYQV